MKPHQQDQSLEDNTSYLMSVSDMMSGLLFIFIITLMAFVINFKIAQDKARFEQEDATAKQDELEKIVNTYTGIEDIRRDLLENLQQTLERRGVMVSVDHEQGVLRLGEGAIRFESNSSELSEEYRISANIVSDALSEVLPCYTELDSLTAINCRSTTVATLEAIFVEGHTDNRPILLPTGEDRNWELSAERAITTYREFISNKPALEELINRNEQRIFSVTGYGASRPLPGRAYSLPTADAENRRIDLRFIMLAPDVSASEVTEQVRERVSP